MTCLRLSGETHLPVQEMQVPSLGWEDLLQKEMATHSRILPGKSHGKRSLVSYNPWGLKESVMTWQLSKSVTASVGVLHQYLTHCILAVRTCLVPVTIMLLLSHPSDFILGNLCRLEKNLE